MRTIYQRLNSLFKQIQTVFSIKVSNDVAGHKGSVIAFRCSKNFREHPHSLSGKDLRHCRYDPAFALKPVTSKSRGSEMSWRSLGFPDG